MVIIRRYHRRIKGGLPQVQMARCSGDSFCCLGRPGWEHAVAVDIEVRLAEGQHLVGGMRAELAVVSNAVGRVQQFLAESDRVLGQVDAGLIAAERAVERSRRAVPIVLVVCGIAGLAVVVIVVRRRNRRREAE